MRLERSWVEIDLGNFRHNLRELKKLLLPGQSFLQIVKADAYGHGAFEISKIAMQEGATYLGVANIEEAKLLRLQGIKLPILILSPALENEIGDILAHDITVSISDYQFAQELSRQAGLSKHKAKVHIKIDTGMHRSGLSCTDICSLWKQLIHLKHLDIEGIFSHYAASESDDAFSDDQTKAFAEALEQIDHHALYIHIGNSSALIKHNPPFANLLRLGILSYGVYTAEEQKTAFNLLPVMTFKSTLSQIKTIKKGEYLGYNLTWGAPQDTKYGIIPVGYADGYDFLLGNKAQVSHKGVLCPVIGKISMDMITVDLGDCPDSAVGEELTLIGATHPELRVENITRLYNGSPYELLCQVGRRARRYFYEDQQIVSSSPLSRRDFVSSDFSDNKLNQIIESAISQRLQSEEIGEMIYREILRSFFFNKDRDIHYRQNFRHSVELLHMTKDGLHYQTKTALTFDKVLQSDYFIVACANSDQLLSRYFKRKDVEYRWLMDDSIALGTDQFLLTNVSINGTTLFSEVSHSNGCMEIRCSHPSLSELVGKQVSFAIETKTLYPCNSHQLSIFINELTRGVEISFLYPPELSTVEVVSVFSGQNKYPEIIKSPGAIIVSTKAEEWVFPMSGIVFAY